MSYRDEELRRVAKLYYRSDLTHQEIAVKLGLTRMQVTRMLKAARERGIVRISIKGEDDFSARISLAAEMELRFNLTKAIIVPRSDEENFDILNAVTKNAGDYFDSILKNGDIVGFGWGMSVAGMVRNYFPSKRRDVLFVPALGGLDERDYVYNLPELIRLMAERCGGSRSTLYAPAIVDNAEVHSFLMKDSNIQKVVGLWDHLDILVIGIGALKSKMPQALRSYLSRQNINLQEMGVMCDLCCNYLSDQGIRVPTELDGRTIGISLECIRKTPTTMAIAVGRMKAEAIHAALWSGCINILVTDEDTALAVLEVSKP